MYEAAVLARGLRAAICCREGCETVMFQYKPVPGFYVLEKCRKCGAWNEFSTETPG
jgi:hypothetical protein